MGLPAKFDTTNIEISLRSSFTKKEATEISEVLKNEISVDKIAIVTERILADNPGISSQLLALKAMEHDYKMSRSKFVKLILEKAIKQQKRVIKGGWNS